MLEVIPKQKENSRTKIEEGLRDMPCTLLDLVQYFSTDPRALRQE